MPLGLDVRSPTPLVSRGVIEGELLQHVRERLGLGGAIRKPVTPRGTSVGLTQRSELA